MQRSEWEGGRDVVTEFHLIENPATGMPFFCVSARQTWSQTMSLEFLAIHHK
jgi:hypothetical protein